MADSRGGLHGPITVIEADGALGAPPGDLSDRRICHERSVAGSPAEVWRLWTTTEGVTSWLVAEARVELRIGGAFEPLFMDDAPAGSRGAEGCRVLSFLPERMLSFTWNAPPSFPEIRRQHTWVVVELEPEDERTRVRVTHLGWPAHGWTDGSDWPTVFEYFDRAWEGVLRVLGEHLDG